MKKRFKKLVFLIQHNIRALLIFETIYRILGIAIIYPLGDQLILLSVRITGKSYITNTSFFDYLSRPTTIIIFFLFFILLAIYILFELIALSILFHLSEQGQSISMQSLFITSFKRLLSTLKKYHIIILISAMIFFVLVEGFHIAGIASTISLPRIITNEFDTFPILKWIFFFIVLIFIWLFIESIFFELQSILSNDSIKDTVKEQKKMLKHNRLQLLLEFIILNIILNIILYGLYLVVIWFVTLIAQLFINTSAVFGILLSFMYIIYLIIGFIGTVFLFAINFAWINVWYYQFHPVKDTSTLHDPPKQRIHFKPSLKPILGGIAIILLGVNIILVRDNIINPSTPIQLLNTPQIIAHRGSSFDAPENTVSAIERAIRDGSDAVEIDVQFTSDGIPILMHDLTLGRTTDDSLNRVVKNTTYEEIAKLDAGSWFDSEFTNEQVPTLEDALISARRRVQLYIEIKAIPPGGIETIVQMLEEQNMIQFVKILSFDEDILLDFKEKNDNIHTVLLLATFLGNVQTLASYDHIDSIAIRYQLIQNNKDYVQDLQVKGKDVYVFTVNSPSLITEMDNYGVNGIITDVPIKAREIVYGDTTNEWFERLLQLLFPTS